MTPGIDASTGDSRNGRRARPATGAHEKTPVNPGVTAACDVPPAWDAMGDDGLEPTQESSGNRGGGDQSGAECGAVGAPKSTFGPELAAVVEAWPELPEHIRAAILALVTSTGR